MTFRWLNPTIDLTVILHTLSGGWEVGREKFCISFVASNMTAGLNIRALTDWSLIARIVMQMCHHELPHKQAY